MSKQRDVLVAFVALVIVGGAGGVGVRFTTLEMPPFFSALMRFGPSALIFWLILWQQKIPLPKGLALRGAIIYGVLSMGIFYGLFYTGIAEVQAGLAAVLLAVGPLFTYFFAVLRRQEQFRWRGLLGGFISLFGVYLTTGGDITARAPLGNQLAIIGAALVLAAATVLYKGYPQNHPLVTNTITLSVGIPLIALASFMFGESWTLPQQSQTIWALAFVIPFGTVLLFLLYFYVLDRWTASATSYAFLLFPISAILFSSWLEGEEITPEFLIGAGLVMFGVWIGVLRGDSLRPD